jgi:hypothetical protein
VSEFDWRERGILDHLLFQTLYHPVQHDVDGERVIHRELSTRCRVRVPEAARLTFAVGYRQPTTVSDDALLTAEIWLGRFADPEQALERVFREEIPLLVATGWASPPALERRVDLASFGGQEIALVFRTSFRGEVGMNDLDFKGFAMAWHDPRIEFEEDAR